MAQSFNYKHCICVAGRPPEECKIPESRGDGAHGSHESGDSTPWNFVLNGDFLVWVTLLFNEEFSRTRGRPFSLGP